MNALPKAEVHLYEAGDRAGGLTAGVKRLVITASFASLAASADFWKEITITEKCECSA
jgi:protoporphyrinogen oxidase